MRAPVLALCLLLASALSAKGECMSMMKAQAAPQRVAEQYSATYGGLLMRSPLDGTALAFPDLTAVDFRLVSETESEWLYTYEPLSGPAIRAHVAKANGFVQFDKVTVSAE